MGQVDRMVLRADELCNHISKIREVKDEKIIVYAGALSQLLSEKDNLIKYLSTISDSYPGVKAALNKLEEV